MDQVRCELCDDGCDVCNHGMRDEWLQGKLVEHYNYQKFDFHWNDDYSMFRPIKLTWWDDASYIAYQSEDHSELLTMPNDVQFVEQRPTIDQDESIPF